MAEVELFGDDGRVPREESWRAGFEDMVGSMLLGLLVCLENVPRERRILVRLSEDLVDKVLDVDLGKRVSYGRNATRAHVPALSSALSGRSKRDDDGALDNSNSFERTLNTAPCHSSEAFICFV
jgi:hypothetical protein